MFLDATGLIESNRPELAYGIAAVDLDADGTTEFVVAGFGSANRVLKWQSGLLRDVTPTILADPDGPAIGLAAGDIDGDGREELYVLNTDSFSGSMGEPDRLFDARPGGRWIDLFSRPQNRFARNFEAGRSVAVLDRRGTGRYGFFVASYGCPMRFYELGPEGALLNLAPVLGFDATTGGRGLWTGPLFGESSDLFCVNEHGPNLLFRNRGDGTFDEATAAFRLADPDENGRGVAALDADNDGRLDLAWGNWDGPNRLMIRQLDGTFRDRATPALALPGPVRTVIAADFDNNGWEELFFNHFGEPNRLFASSAGRAKVSSQVSEWVMLDPGPAAEPHGLGTGAAVADVDGDGILELLVSHGETTPQPLSLYKVLTDNAWLRVQPLTRFGAPARGALVRLAAGDRTQVRVIDGGSGYLCQMEPVAHFGLGLLKTVDSIGITWPDGASLSIANPAARQMLIVPYPRS